MRHLLKIIILFSIIGLLAPTIVSARLSNKITVTYRGTTDIEYITLTYIDNLPFFNALELNKTLNAFISADTIDNRLFIDIYGKRLIFLLETSYMICGSQTYNLIHPHKNIAGNHYLPLTFLEKIIPLILDNKISYDPKTKEISAEYPEDMSFHTIVIDPGHGGKDPGAIGYSKNNYEKNIVIQIAEKIKKLVEDNLDVRVLITREDDSFISLHNRTEFANKHRANLFLSLHCNASPNRHAEGIEVFFLSAARTGEARAVEILENSVVEKYEGGADAVKKYDDLSFILMDMSQTEQLRESSYLAIKLQANLIKNTGAVDRGVKQAGFYVLRGAYMPAVLIEFGFISNPQEEKNLIKDSYQNKLAEAVYNGISNYIYNYEMFR